MGMAKGDLGMKSTVTVKNTPTRPIRQGICLTYSFPQWRKLEAKLVNVPKEKKEFLAAEKGFDHIDKGIKDFLRRGGYV